jgi:hypothetical protein
MISSFSKTTKAQKKPECDTWIRVSFYLHSSGADSKIEKT